MSVRSELIQVRVTPDELENLRVAAVAARRTVTDYVRVSALENAALETADSRLSQDFIQSALLVRAAVDRMREEWGGSIDRLGGDSSSS